jgi:hypothetical protein
MSEKVETAPHSPEVAMSFNQRELDVLMSVFIAAMASQDLSICDAISHLKNKVTQAVEAQRK